MVQDFHSAPAPMRITCRYSNGIIESYGVRALAYDEASLRVLSAKNFERGVNLRVLAPFLGGAGIGCWVAASTRSQQYPAYFELELNFSKKRRSRRHPIRYPVEVSDVDKDGKARKEQTHTLYVSQHGASVRSRICRPKDSSIRLELLPPQEGSSHCRVAWITHYPDAEGYFTMGVDLGDTDFSWPVESVQELVLTGSFFPA